MNKKDIPKNAKPGSYKKVNVFDFLDYLFEEEEAPELAERSDEWYSGIIKQVFNQKLELEATPETDFFINSLSQDNIQLKAKQAQQRVGEMVMFRYLPPASSWKELPYFDTLPLIVILDIGMDGFMGLNLHYLAHKHRRRLMARLMQKRSGPIEISSTRMNINMEMLSMAQYKYHRPCIRRYSLNRIRSRLIQIYPKNWMNAINIPSERFKKANKNRIWNDSKQMVQQYSASGRQKIKLKKAEKEE